MKRSEKNRFIIRTSFWVALLLVGFTFNLNAQAKTSVIIENEAQTKLSPYGAPVDSLTAVGNRAAVVLDKDTLFYVWERVGGFTPTEQAHHISQKLRALIDYNDFDENQFTTYSGTEGFDILYKDELIAFIPAHDTLYLSMSLKMVSEEYLAKIKRHTKDQYEHSNFWYYLKRILLILLVIVIVTVIIYYLNKTLRIVNTRILKYVHKYFRGIKIRSYELISGERMDYLLGVILKVLKWGIILFIFYLSMPIIFSMFPETEGIARTLIGYIISPLKTFFIALYNFIPKLITITLIIVITRTLLRLLKYFRDEVESGNLKINGFYPDWAQTTYSLMRGLLIVLSFIMIFPNLPGSDSEVFQGVSIFIGLLISIGSSSAINNAIAGLVITYMRPFRIGDRVQIGSTVGDVVEKTLLVTRLKTIKNEEVTIPNSAILSGQTINYTTSAKEIGLILHTTITIGYDVPWRKVHDLLISAALNTPDVVNDPKPFVLQTSLDDFYISYEINATTHKAQLAKKIYSDLHANIQDAFNEAGVEIMSPHYQANRTGEKITIPEK